MADRFTAPRAPAVIGNENGQYSLGGKLGQGGFGVVYMALNTMTGQSVAVKSVLSRNLTEEGRATIQAEINLLRMLDHPNIVKYIDTIAQDTDLYIVLEYMENGSIGAMRKKFKFQEPLIAHWIEQVLRGLEYLHNQGVLHRDIKGANILTTKEGVVKLADFGVAIKSSALGAEDGEEDIDVVGTPYWMAPEIIQMSKPTEACDIWSVGCTIIELVTGKPPYYDLQPMQALFRIVSDDYPPFPDNLSRALHDFLIACFQKDPNMRPRAADLLKAGKYRWLQAKTKMHDEKADATDFAASVGGAEGADAPDERDHEVIDQTVRIAREQSNKLHEQLAHSRGAARDSTASPAFSDDDGDFHTAKGPLSLPSHPGKIGDTKDLDLDAFVDMDEDDEGEATIKLGKVRLLLPTDKGASSASTDRSKAAAPDLGSDDEDWDAAFADDDDDASAGGEDEDQTIRFNAKLKFPTAAFSKAGPKGPVGAVKAGESRGHARISSVGFGLLGKNDAAVRLNAFRDDDEDDMDGDFGLDGDFDLGEDDELKLMHAAAEEAKSDSLTLSNRGTMYGPEDSASGGLDDDDPFAGFDDDEDDEEEAAARDLESERLRECMALMAELAPSASDSEIERMCERLIELFTHHPRIRENLMTQYGVVPIMEMLATVQRESVLPAIVRVINVIIEDNERIQEHVSLMGLLPVMIRFAKSDVPPGGSPHRRLLSTRSARKPRAITPLQVEATRFVRRICIDDSEAGRSKKTVLQMFIGCGGLELLVHLLSLACAGSLGAEPERRECVCTAIDGVTRVFTLQTLRKNDFCRLLSKYGMILYLLDAFDKLNEAGDEVYLIKVAKLLEEVSNYSRADVLLNYHLAQRQVLFRVMEALRATSDQSEALLLLLKSVKHVCMSRAQDAVNKAAGGIAEEDAMTILEDADVIEYLVQLLDKAAAAGPAQRWFKDVEYQAVPSLFYLCLVNKKRQEKAAAAGIVPHLRRYIEGRSHLQQFATQILLYLAHAGSDTRRILRAGGAIELYLRLLGHQNWDNAALDAIAVCFLGDIDDAELEAQVVGGVGAIVEMFLAARGRKAESSLETLMNMTGASPRLSCALGDEGNFMRELVVRLTHAQALQKVNLLKVLKAIYHSRPNPSSLIGQYSLYDLLQSLANDSDAVLVRQLAAELFSEFNRRSSTMLVRTPQGSEDEGPSTPRATNAAPAPAHPHSPPRPSARPPPPPQNNDEPTPKAAHRAAPAAPSPAMPTAAPAPSEGKPPRQSILKRFKRMMS